ncbi:MFS transporter [Nocardioides sp.]|uniref:MFS transporter n=1 Tax=Nocardioides sp. TaxID=35761 RepID=UPI003566FEFC
MTLLNSPEAAAAMAPPTTSLLAPRYRWATIGMVSLIFIAAFEALAVTTIMPTVSADLDGRTWFSATFSATLAASVVGMVAGGLWADRSGPRTPLLASVTIFGFGLLLAGLSPSIELFVAARFIQGLGSGAMTVGLYVVVARIYDAVDHPRIFGAFAAAWVIPGMVGPSIAGVVAEILGWRWVFLGVVALAFAAMAMLLPGMRGVADNPEPSPIASAGRLALAAVVAGSVVGLDVAGHATGPVALVGAAIALTVVVTAVRPLLPPGTLGLRRGLPSVIALRGAIAATFFATEIYLPYLLQARYDVAPWLAGATLTVGALGWAGASQVQARLGARLPHRVALRIGAALLLGGVTGALVTATAELPPPLLAIAWMLAGAGMGTMYPRISALVLAASTVADQGSNSAAMSISDAVGGASAISVAGFVFTSVGTGADLAPFVAVFALTTALAGSAVAIARRADAR